MSRDIPPIELKPCPECHKNDMVFVRQNSFALPRWYIKCGRCNLITNTCHSIKAAKTSWNMRAIHPSKLRKIMQGEDNKYGK